MSTNVNSFEVNLVLDVLKRQYGFDFHNYTQPFLTRRLNWCAEKAGLDNISDLVPQLQHSQQAATRMVQELSICVTELYRDAEFFRSLCDSIDEYLRSVPFVKIWHAGCATGEEVWSLAALLEERGLGDHTQIYATDLNTESLNTAREGIYRSRDLTDAQYRYRAAGGRKALMDHFTSRYGSSRITDNIRRRVTFAQHNLVTDGVFGDMNLIVCRNVLIYFDRDLQNRVLKLFRDSLACRGFLCLGSKESLCYSDVAKDFEVVDEHHRVFRMNKRGIDYE